MTELKLNLGCGTQRLDGFLGVDVGGAYDIEHDLSVMPWPFESGSVTEIVASHVLEHFDRRQGVLFLGECFRILAKGGYLHLAVPDMDKFIDCRLAGDYSPLGGYRWTSLDDLLGGGEHEANEALRHKYMYCAASLKHTVAHSGFWTVVVRHCPQRWDNLEHQAFSLYADAVK